MPKGRILLKWQIGTHRAIARTISNSMRFSTPSIARLAFGLCLLIHFCAVLPDTARAQLRIVTYNTATGNVAPGVQTARPNMNVVLGAIGEEERNGFAKPIDVLLLQEQWSSAISAQSIVDVLNGIYGPGTYARGVIDAYKSDPTGQAGGPGIVYNTQTVQLVSESRFGTVNGSSQARSTIRYQIHPLGYDSTADFYVYNDHYKAGSATSDRDRRDVEATSIRGNVVFGSDLLPEGTHIIYAGDYNVQSSNEASFQTLLAAGNGQAFDPINRLGSWTNNANFADIHSQSPCVSSCVGTSGGMDDRFDFQLVTGEMLDGEGLDYISGSYHAFGNDGSTLNNNINAASNTVTFPGVSSYTKGQVLNALWNTSDHLPVVADYQLPAVLDATLGSVPTTLDLGEEFLLDVMVRNAANVLVPLGADELDYSVTTSGDLFGSFLDQMDMALDDGNVHQIMLDTSTPGMKTGMITVESSSPMVADPLRTFAVSFEVLAALYGDYNDDGTVNAADYVLWRTNPESLTNDSTPESVSIDDYQYWRDHFGDTLAGQGAGSVQGTVPEPGTWLLLLVGACLLPRQVGTLKACSRVK
jgi:hypothetical protein